MRAALIFVEDPGAVNCVAPLAEELGARGLRVALLSAGLGTQLLRARGLNPMPIASENEAIDALAQAQPDWLVVGTSENLDSSAFVLVAAARAAGVPSAAVIDFAANAAHRFRGRTADPLAHAPDYVLVPDECTRDEFVALGIDAERVAVVGHPHHDHVAGVAARLQAAGRDAARDRTLPEGARGRPVLLFASEISTGLDPDQYRRSAEYTLLGRGGAHGRTEIVVEELLDAVRDLAPLGVVSPFMILRRHPKESDADLAGYASSFDWMSAGGDVLELLFAADLVVGMSSMLLTEAHMLGTPVISLLPRAVERNWLPIVRTGAVPCATDRVALRTLLRAKLVEIGRAQARAPANTGGATAQRSVERLIRFLEAAARIHRAQTEAH